MMKPQLSSWSFVRRAGSRSSTVRTKAGYSLLAASLALTSPSVPIDEWDVLSGGGLFLMATIVLVVAYRNMVKSGPGRLDERVLTFRYDLALVLLYISISCASACSDAKDGFRDSTGVYRVWNSR